MQSDPLPETIMHATSVAFGPRGVLILGPSGSGKSTLGLALMALGALLVADDRTALANVAGQLIARCPPALHGLIEARGLGLIRATPLDEARIHLVVDLARQETERLPPIRHISLCGVTCDLVFGQQSPHFPSLLLAYIQGGRQA